MEGLKFYLFLDLYDASIYGSGSGKGILERFYDGKNYFNERISINDYGNIIVDENCYIDNDVNSNGFGKSDGNGYINKTGNG